MSAEIDLALLASSNSTERQRVEVDIWNQLSTAGYIRATLDATHAVYLENTIDLWKSLSSPSQPTSGVNDQDVVLQSWSATREASRIVERKQQKFTHNLPDNQIGVAEAYVELLGREMEFLCDRILSVVAERVGAPSKQYAAIMQDGQINLCFHGHNTSNRPLPAVTELHHGILKAYLTTGHSRFQFLKRDEEVFLTETPKFHEAIIIVGETLQLITGDGALAALYKVTPCTTMDPKHGLISIEFRGNHSTRLPVDKPFGQSKLLSFDPGYAFMSAAQFAKRRSETMNTTNGGGSSAPKATVKRALGKFDK